MRVLQIYRDYFGDLPGGIERHVSDLMSGLNHEVEVAVGDKHGPRGSSDGPVHHMREYARLGGVPVTPSLVGLVRRGRYDVIHVHSPDPTGEVVMAMFGGSAARVLTYHTDIDRGSRFAPVYERLFAYVFDHCERVITTSERLVERSRVLSDLHHRDPEKLTVIPLGVDIERFTPEATERSRALSERWSSPVVLFLGRLRYYKGLTFLIDAMRNVPGVLVIAGDGPDRTRIHDLARASLGERAILLGAPTEEELPDVYRACDVFCLPSISHAEAFGLSAVEAMASGKPVVTTEVGTATSLINKDGETGLVVPPRDARSLSEALHSLVEDRGAAKRMGEAARSRVVERYDRRIMLDRIATVYEEAVANHKVPRDA
jgi:rhamnosyl/mannosyltransferase